MIPFFVSWCQLVSVSKFSMKICPLNPDFMSIKLFGTKYDQSSSQLMLNKYLKIIENG